MSNFILFTGLLIVAYAIINDVTFKSRRIKLGDAHPHTLDSWHNLIELYEAWGKSEKAAEWRAKLPQKEALKK